MRLGVDWSSGYHGHGCCGGYCGGGYDAHHSYSCSTSISVNYRVSVGNSYNSNRPRAADLRDASRDSIDNPPENRARNVDRAKSAGQLKNTGPAAGKADNVFADKDGSIARKVHHGWESRCQKGREKPGRARGQRLTPARHPWRLGRQIGSPHRPAMTEGPRSEWRLGRASERRILHT